MNIGVIGLGLIGGSMAIDLKKRHFATKVFGCDRQKLHAQTALQMNIIDEIVDLDELIEKSEIIIISTPVDAAHKLLSTVLDKVTTQTVCDVCSTKGKMVELIKYHPNRENYVATHPMAGTEFSGPWAAISNLFDSKAAILCNITDSGHKHVEKIEELYTALNMRIIYMDAYQQDTHSAYVSHISHISSFALALTVLEKEKNEKNIFDLASGGFDSTVRLAKSSAEMWNPIFVNNKDNVLTVLDTYIEKLGEFREAINNSDSNELTKMIESANKIKKTLK
jgi:prephenate dehydrogenase